MLADTVHMFTIPEIQLCRLRIKAYKDRAQNELNKYP